MSKPYRAWKRDTQRATLGTELPPPHRFLIFLPSLPLGQSHMPHNQLGLEFGLASEGHEAQEGQLPAVR